MTVRSDPGRAAARLSPVERSPARHGRWPLVVFIVLAYGLSWAWLIPMAVTGQLVASGQGWPTHYPAVFGPAVAAFVVIAAVCGRAGVTDLLRRIVLWRVGWRWWLVGLSPLLFLGVAVPVSLLVGGALPRIGDFGLFSGLPAVGVLWVSLLLILGAFGEEIGWRGFALPSLQRRFGPLVASLILGGLWALWHLPLFFVITSYRAFGVPQIIGLVFALTCGAIVFTWIYNRTGGSILLVAVWHGLFNVITGTAAGTGMVAVIVSIIVMAQALLLVGLHLWAGHNGRPSPLRAPIQQTPGAPGAHVGEQRPQPGERR